jgi:hypothetical protein
MLCGGGQFVREAAPKLARDIGGVQIPVIKNPSGDTPLDLGLVLDPSSLPRLRQASPVTGCPNPSQSRPDPSSGLLDL